MSKCNILLLTVEALMEKPLSVPFPVVLIHVFVECAQGGYHKANYDTDICMGELIRNLCVHLRIDPDTRNGITRNVTVGRMNPV